MPVIEKRIMLLLAVISLVMLALACVYINVQVVRGPDIAHRAMVMRTRAFYLFENTRGDILDRNYRPITGSLLPNGCFFIPALSADIRMTALAAAGPLHESSWKLEHAIRTGIERGERIILLGNHSGLSPSDKARLEDIPGIFFAPVVRRYPANGLAIHITGLLGSGPRGMPNTVGVSGIESRYDQWLQGKQPRGEVKITVDGRGRVIPGLTRFRNDADGLDPASDVCLTLDRELQQQLEFIANQRVLSGAIVVLDVETRDILAMVSRPGFDPVRQAGNQPIPGESMMNKALRPYHPGSIFKVAVAAAALTQNPGVTSVRTACTGSYVFPGGLTIKCWNEKGHGTLGFTEALAESCNVWFIRTGLATGRDAILSACQALRLTDRDIIGYPNAQAGSMINIDYGGPALANAVLGQKGVLLTPLQIANLMATLADQGRYKRPRLVREIRKGNEVIQYNPADRGDQVLDPNVVRELTDSMEAVTSGGTGKRASLDCGVAGKTATAQTGRYQANGEEILNTWFAGYFPAHSPRWAICVFVENGRSGSLDAAPVFQAAGNAVLERYKGKNRSKREQ
ncbi:MAG: peptidoglycan D,D-transpeptidase FtsI family protein [Solirubrobacterales bacterium]